MASLKILLWNKPNSEGKYPIALRIIKDRVPSYIYIYYIDKTDWDEANRCVKKTNPNFKHINNLILKKLSDASNDVLEILTQKKQVSSKSIKKKIKPTTSATFKPQADLYLKNLRAAGKFNEYTPNKTRIERFSKFVKRDIPFQEITPSLLNQFRIYLKKNHNVGERTILNHLSAIRSVFASAVREEAIPKEITPFGKKGVKIKFPETAKVGLALKDIDNLEQVELTGKAHHSRNLWLFSFYFAGMRISDVLQVRWSDFQNNRLYYGMDKNDKFGSLKIPNKAQKILQHYAQFKENSDDLVFPELKGKDLNDDFNIKRVIGYSTSSIDKYLRLYVAPKAGIEKSLTMHIARHTFAQLAGDEIPLPVLQRLYRHSDIKTTMGYQSHFTTDDTDKALDKVLRKKEKKALVPN